MKVQLWPEDGETTQDLEITRRKIEAALEVELFEEADTVVLMPKPDYSNEMVRRAAKLVA
jgi:hypothetical protein